jgi:hypothetical protein
VAAAATKSAMAARLEVAAAKRRTRTGTRACTAHAPAPAPTPAPEGWTCSRSRSGFSVTGRRRSATAAARTGRQGVNGGGTCSNEFFGNDARGTIKQCELSHAAAVVAPSPLPAPIVAGARPPASRRKRCCLRHAGGTGHHVDGLPRMTGVSRPSRRGGDLQAVLTRRSRRRDLLASGATFTGNFELPVSRPATPDCGPRRVGARDARERG